MKWDDYWYLFSALTDINECLLGASNCRGGERCINTEGSFRCQREVSCGTGYELTDNNNCKGEWKLQWSHLVFNEGSSRHWSPCDLWPYQTSMSVRLRSTTAAATSSARTPRGRSAASPRSSVVQVTSRTPWGTALVSKKKKKQSVHTDCLCASCLTECLALFPLLIKEKNQTNPWPQLSKYPSQFHVRIHTDAHNSYTYLSVSLSQHYWLPIFFFKD